MTVVLVSDGKPFYSLSANCFEMIVSFKCLLSECILWVLWYIVAGNKGIMGKDELGASINANPQPRQSAVPPKTCVTAHGLD
eukprot:2193148-Ditylum_brightwellii.AAC.1